MNIRNGLTITCVLLLAALMGCGQRAGDAKLPESKEAKQLLQGVWSGEDTEDVVFQLRGDSVYYPDSTSMPAFFRVYDDTLYIGSSARYHIEKHTNHVLWFKGSDGEVVKLVKGDGDEDKELFERNKTQILTLAEVLKKDTVVSYNGNRYHLYIAVNPTKYKVVRHTINDDGLDVENVYYAQRFPRRQRTFLARLPQAAVSAARPCAVLRPGCAQQYGVRQHRREGLPR